MNTISVDIFAMCISNGDIRITLRAGNHNYYGSCAVLLPSEFNTLSRPGQDALEKALRQVFQYGQMCKSKQIKLALGTLDD